MSQSKASPVNENEQELDQSIKQLTFLKRKIDRDIGWNYWKKYVASAFWSQISTPINLVITFLTAITAAQAQSQDLIPESLYSQIAITSLVITTLNTFFRPHVQYTTNTEYLAKWIDAGVRLEKLFADKVTTTEKIKIKITEYEKLQEDINNLRKQEGANTINFVTDLLFLIAYKTCIGENKTWLSFDKKLDEEAKEKAKIAHEKREGMLKDMEEWTKKQEDFKIVNEESTKMEVRIQLAKLKQKELQTYKELGFTDVRKGDWFVSMKVDNDVVWNNYLKTGLII